MKMYDLSNDERGLSRLYLDLGVQFFRRILLAGETMRFESPNEVYGPSPTFSILVYGKLSVNSISASETIEVTAGPGSVLQNFHPGTHEVLALEDSYYICVSPAPKELLARGLVDKLATIEGRTLTNQESNVFSHQEGYRAIIPLHGSCLIKGREVAPGDAFLIQEGEQADVMNLSYCEIALCR